MSSGATSVQNWARQNPPFLRLGRRRACAAVRFRAHDAKFLRVDFDALGQRAKVIAAIAAALGPHSLARRPGKGLD